MLGGRLVNPTTTNSDERKLLNVVEEMAIASGMRVPTVYVMQEEAGINAFAAGFDPSRSIIAVTRGTLQTLNRDDRVVSGGAQVLLSEEFRGVMDDD